MRPSPKMQALFRSKTNSVSAKQNAVGQFEGKRVRKEEYLKTCFLHSLPYSKLYSSGFTQMETLPIACYPLSLLYHEKQ